MMVDFTQHEQEMSREKQIEEMAKVVRGLTFVLRTNMTSITRYVRLERANHPTLTEGQFLDRHLEYRKLANVAVDNILKCLNDNEALTEIERLQSETKQYVNCSVCGKKLYLGEEVLTIPGYCGIYCSPNCFTENFCCKTPLTKEFAFKKDVLVKKGDENESKAEA